MPTAPPRSCAVSGCLDYATRYGRCAVHVVPILQARERRDEAGRHWYQSARWRKLRERILSIDPLCRHCMARESRPVPATEVDHIDRHGGNAIKFWSGRNLQPLCAPCHARKTTIERGHRVSRLPVATGGGIKSLERTGV